MLVIVLANNGYLSIRQTHENFFGEVVGATPAPGSSFRTINVWPPPMVFPPSALPRRTTGRYWTLS